MRNQSIFGEIVTRLSTQPENIATEALLYLLQRYPSAWESLRMLLERSGIKLDENCTFRTQTQADDGCIPDLIAVDRNGDKVLVLEAKFWAGLTPNQPANYLRLLPNNKPAMVLVVAPGLRFQMLWQKLLGASEDGGLTLSSQLDVNNEFRVASVGHQHLLGLLSWRVMLSIIKQNAEAASESDLVDDTEQLAGLCARMDGEAFLPLSEADLSPSIGRRVQQFADLVDDSVGQLTEQHGADSRGLTVGGKQCVYGRFFRIRGYIMFLCSDPKRWSTSAETPIWVSFCDSSSTTTPLEISESLSVAFAADSRICTTDGDGVWIPLKLPLAVERNEVLDRIVDQIMDLVQIALPQSPASSLDQQSLTDETK